MARSLAGLGSVIGLILLGVVVAPVVALLPAMVVDRGAGSSPRLSAFPAALVVLDPLVWRCVRNSVLVALAVTMGSMVLGTSLGIILGRRRFWGRWVLGGLAIMPLAVGPMGLTPGVVSWVGGGSGWEWLAARSLLGQPGDDWGRWFILVWVELATATPLVILTTRAGLRQVNPVWLDAARVVGAGRWRVWWDVTWPTIRPDLARVGALIFTLTLVEPAGPILLGLQRTLAFELAHATLMAGPPNLAATLAMIAVLIAVVVRRLLVRWGGPLVAIPRRGGQIAFEPRAGVRLGGLAVGVCMLWLVVSLGPAVSFARTLASAANGGEPWTWATVAEIVARWNSVEMRAWAGNSAITASLAIGLDLIFVACLGGGARWASRGLAAVPPLVLAVGALTIPSLLATWADSTTWPALAVSLQAIRVELSPGRSPGLLLVVVLAATWLPVLARRSAPTDRRLRRDSLDAALLAGASLSQARRIGLGRSGMGATRGALVAWTWASTDLAAAWVLTALDERRTLAPAALRLIEPGASPVDPRLLGLLGVLVGVRLLGLILAAPGRPMDQIRPLENAVGRPI